MLICIVGIHGIVVSSLRVPTLRDGLWRQPGAEPKDDPRLQAISQAAMGLVEQRHRWLNAEGLSDTEKKKRTLTNL